jgi:hypothetical protein
MRVLRCCHLLLVPLQVVLALLLLEQCCNWWLHCRTGNDAQLCTCLLYACLMLLLPCCWPHLLLPRHVDRMATQKLPEDYYMVFFKRLLWPRKVQRPYTRDPPHKAVGGTEAVSSSSHASALKLPKLANLARC